MANTGREEYFHKILVFFGVVTAIISIFNLAASGDITMGDMGSGVLAGQVIPEVNVIGVDQLSVTGQDYTNTNTFDANITKGVGFTIGDMWTQADGVGYTATNIPILPLFHPALLEIFNVLPDKGNYTITYAIDPAGVPDFYTVVWSLGPYGTFIKYDSTGAHLMFLNVLGMQKSSESFEYPCTGVEDLSYPGANSATAIQTIYNPDKKTIDVIIDGYNAGKFTGVSPPNAVDKVYSISYGGVATYYTGLIVQGMTGKFISTTNLGTVELAENDIWTSVTGTLGLIAAAMGLTRDPLVPFWLWGIVASPCLATLGLILYEMFRGN